MGSAGPPDAVPPHSTTAYLDTVEMFVHRLPTDVGKRVQFALGRPCRIDEWRDKGGAIFGWRIIVHQPNHPVLEVFAAFEREVKARLCRVDVAFDFAVRNSHDKAALRRWLEQHAQIRRSPHDPMLSEYDTLYWVWQSGRTREGKRRSRRDVALYSDRCSKAGVGCEIDHFELKFYRSETLRRQGIRTVKDLPFLSPRALFVRNIKLVDFTFERNGRNLLRSITDSYRASSRSLRTKPDRPAYRFNMKERTWGLVTRLSLHRIQGFKSLYPVRARRLRSLSPDLLSLPEKVLVLDTVQGRRCCLRCGNVI